MFLQNIPFDQITHYIMQFGILDLVLVGLGFIAAQFKQLMLPVQLTIFMVKVIQWWMKTHPHGKEIAKHTNLDEQFERIFGKHLEKYSDNSASKVDTTEKSTL